MSSTFDLSRNRIWLAWLNRKVEVVSFRLQRMREP